VGNKNTLPAPYKSFFLIFFNLKVGNKNTLPTLQIFFLIFNFKVGNKNTLPNPYKSFFLIFFNLKVGNKNTLPTLQIFFLILRWATKTRYQTPTNLFLRAGKKYKAITNTKPPTGNLLKTT